MIDKKKKLELLLNEFSKNLQTVFTDHKLKKEIEKFDVQRKLSQFYKKKLYTCASKLEIVWEDKPHAYLYSYKPDNIELEDLIGAWTYYKNQYVSHYGALYLNDLILQRPRDFHITREALSTSFPIKNLLTEAAIKQAFLKPERATKQKGYYKGSTFYFHDKKIADLCGIIEIELRGIKIKTSDIERTFLDSIMAPQYAGGVPTIIEAFQNTEINILKLINYYKLMNPVYPYWQRIGFILDMINPMYTQEINDFFGRPQMKFYLDKEYRDEWKFDEKWAIFYPVGLAK